MSNQSRAVTIDLLREWGMPEPGDSKKTRGEVVVVGGSSRTPGAVLLAGEAALRVGAGRLGLLVPEPVQVALAIAMPESAAWGLPASARSPLTDDLREALEAADAVLVGPGFDDPDETRDTLRAVAACDIRCLVLDAFALGVLDEVPREELPKHLVLTPNAEEAGMLLGRAVGDDPVADLREISRRHDAVISCYGDIVSPAGDAWRLSAGGAGLGTSGSGDVLAGAITGIAARGVDPAQAAVWGSWAHARAGDRLTEQRGIGFLARDIAAELTWSLDEVTGRQATSGTSGPSLGPGLSGAER
jgi:hydroxyethylthiazole kinase-like uncharacterized protein yjeF